MDTKIKVVIMPWQPDLLAACGLWILTKLGWLDENYLLLTNQRPLSLKSKELAAPEIYFLTGTDLLKRLEQELPQFRYNDKMLIRSLLQYATTTRNQQKLEEKFQNLNPGLFKQFVFNFIQASTSKAGYISSLELIEAYFKARINPRLDSLKKIGSLSPSDKEPLKKYSGGEIYLTIPKWDKIGPGAAIIGTERVSLKENHVGVIEENQIKLAICGPPGSGKSTIAATLVSEMLDLLDSLKSRSDFADLRVGVAAVDLDLGSPTLGLISSCQGQDRDLHCAQKQPWRIEAVYPAIQQFNLQPENILIVDLPGKVDLITKLLLLSCDCAIITTADWAGINDWRRVLTNCGVIHLSESRSHPLPNEGHFESLVRQYQPGEFLSGRFVGASRQMRNWDSYIQFLARALLFDLLPAFIKRRNEKKRKILQVLQNL